MSINHKLTANVTLLKDEPVKLLCEDNSINDIIYSIGLALPLEATDLAQRFVHVNVIKSKHLSRTLWPLESPVSICFAKYNDFSIVAHEIERDKDYITEQLRLKALLQSLLALPIAVKNRSKTIITMYIFLLRTIGSEQLAIIFDEPFSISLLGKISTIPDATLRRLVKHQRFNHVLLESLQPFAKSLKAITSKGKSLSQNFIDEPIDDEPEEQGRISGSRELIIGDDEHE
ncbi:hypothetical protein M0C34_17915 [Agarivorans sp. TSD2052]|uniref:hypothetical protein n=1 Tax=Agarivorans sp. TSD2052 TaxID=2937286 RepID=UPI00200ED110|nr:hypothetical protein [Agarivorans sp. TSD2052]UPW18078.1 hypothetical protein M0C34_17915 [Agarivorans sp. TSD2052]